MFTRTENRDFMVKILIQNVYMSVGILYGILDPVSNVVPLDKTYWPLLDFSVSIGWPIDVEPYKYGTCGLVSLGTTYLSLFWGLHQKQTNKFSVAETGPHHRV